MSGRSSNLQGLVAKRIAEQRKQMTKSQCLVADFILNEADEALSLTSSDLAKKVGVSAATVVRFARILGYLGYLELQQDLAQDIRQSLSSIERIALAKTKKTSRIDSEESYIQATMLDTVSKLKEMSLKSDSFAFEAAVDKVICARKIYVLGLGSSAALAGFLAFYLKQVQKDVLLVQSGDTAELAEPLLLLDERDLLIVLSFPRYAKRCLEVLEMAQKRKLKLLVITDSLENSLAETADTVLIAESGMLANVDNLILPFVLVSVLAAKVGFRAEMDLQAYHEKLEDLYSFYNDKN